MVRYFLGSKIQKLMKIKCKLVSNKVLNQQIRLRGCKTLVISAIYSAMSPHSLNISRTMNIADNQFYTCRIKFILSVDLNPNIHLKSIEINPEI